MTESGVVRGVGSVSSKIWCIAESPGETEIREGVPLCGPSGNVFNQLLVDTGIRRDSIYIDNVMQIRPPANDFSVFYTDKQRKIPSDELLARQNELRNLVLTHKPYVVICLGAEALRALTGKVGIDKWRGSVLHLLDTNILATYHPAYILRQWSFYPVAKMDIAKAKSLLSYAGTLATPPVTLITEPTFGQAIQYLESAKQSKLLAYDIETSEGLIDCIGFCNSESSSICIPFCKDGGDGNYWSEDQDTLIWQKVKELLESPVPKVAQNVMYDNFILASTYSIYTSNVVLDTMIAFGLLYPSKDGVGMQKSLDFLASVYTNYPYWGEAPKTLGIDRWRYNCMDTLITLTVASHILRDLETAKLKDFYYQLPHRLIDPLLTMSLRGVRFDRDLRNSLRSTYRSRMNRLHKGINRLVTPTEIELAQSTIKSLKKTERGIFNPDSDTQLRNLIHTVWKQPKILSRDTASSKVDEAAIRKIAKKDPTHSRFYGALLQYNSIAKQYSTYLSIEVSNSDKRVRCSYNIAGTVTGRLSSSTAPDGSGTNLQNIPPGIVKQLFLPDGGYTMYECDLSQAENRIVAYMSEDLAMIDAFEHNQDIHTLIASMLLRKSTSTVSKKERQLGKKVGHATNYGMGPKRLCEVCHEELGLTLSMSEAKRLQQQYLDAFPKIRIWHLEVQEQLRNSRTLINPLGRRRYFFERWGDELFKQAYAHLPQSTIVDLLNTGLIKLHTMGIQNLLQVHDSIVYQLPGDIRSNANVAPMTHIVEALKTPIIIKGRKITVPVEIKSGSNWNDLKPIKLEANHV